MKTQWICLIAAAILVPCLTGCGQKIALFNGQNLDGWKFYLSDSSVAPEKVWSVNDGILHCKGVPAGYIRTAQSYSNYTLSLQWRWTDKPTNSGVMLHAVGEDKLWPLCIEAQLMNQNAGDLVTIQKGSVITVGGKTYQRPEDRIYEIVAKQRPSSEKPIGQWNTYKIVCKGNTINLYVNGVHQNSAIGVSPSAGAICLQSEGSPIEFRNICLIPF
jgi:hypothetical protein